MPNLFPAIVSKPLKITNPFTLFLSKIQPIFTLLETDTSRFALSRLWTSIQAIGFFFSNKHKKGWFEKVRVVSFFIQILVDSLFLISYYKRNGDTQFVRKLKEYFCLDYTPNTITVPIDTFVNKPLFSQYFTKVMEVESVFKLNVKEDLESLTLNSLRDSKDVIQAVVFGFFQEKKVVLKITPVNIEFFTESESSKTFDVFSISVIQEIVNDLKNSLIEIKAPASGISRWDDYTMKFQISEFHIPEVFDKHLFDAIYPAVKVAFEKNMKTGILLYGDYGVSKTTTVNYLMSNFDVLKVRVANDAYALAKNTLEGLETKKIVVIDDADVSSEGEKDSGVTELLNFLDSSSYTVAIIIVNDLNNICPAVIRAGRCDIKIYCPKPSKENILEILYHLYDLNPNLQPSENEIHLVSDRLVGTTHAVVRTVFNNAIRYNISLLDSAQKTLEMEKLNVLEDSLE